mmetsp:Transcript_31180/g.81770  ORF Transcript_31180/g.81770 Transcript_31180/m.81770 type:complete len:241 (+) Transcript_31180:137-859(+)
MPSAPKPYRKRLLKEYKQLIQSPAPHILAVPMPANILEWRFCLYGLKEGAYAGGYYHGRLMFPEGYPFKPPGIMMLTPSGRFQAGSRICMSMSDFHPEQWNPAWSVESILKGLLSFMLESTQTAGSVVTTDAEKRRLARLSLRFNLADATFCELFPEAVEMINSDLVERDSGVAAGPGAAGPAGGAAPPARAAAEDVNGMPKPPESPLDSTTSNLFLVVAVAIFAYMVMTIVNDAEYEPQ